jgi:hypothetical protein
VGRFASLCFASLSAKNMAHHIFQLESELQNTPEASRSFSVSEKLTRFGSSALTGVEHLTLLLGKESVALALIRLLVRSRLWPALPFRNYGNSFRGVRLSPLLLL